MMESYNKAYVDEWETEYDEYEEVYQNALITVRLIEENRALRATVARLEKRDRENQMYIDQQYQSTIKQTGNILSALIDQEQKSR